MSNFDLKIIPSGKSTVVIADSEFGEAMIPLSQEFISDMNDNSKRLRGLYEGIFLNPDISIEEEVTNFGERLFDGVFKGEVLDLFNRTLGGSNDGQLNIRVMPGIPVLNTIQWEVMRFRGEYIGFRHNLFRHPFVLRPIKIPSNTRKILHVLQVAVDPIYGMQAIDEEHRHFVDLLKGFGDQIRVTTLVQEEATVENIIDVLFQGVDIWHFTGHGSFDAENPLESSLIVWGSNGEKYGRLSVRSLRTLAMSQSLGFCFLNACNTARTPDEENKKERRATGEYFVNMAHSLIEAGIPMVVATNHQITVQAATRLSYRFYTSIIKYGRRVDQAIREARAELYLGGKFILSTDWSCPVLYTRSRYNELGTERLRWESSDIYSIRNVVRPSLVSVLKPSR